jgi:hypothetical protein
MLAVGSVVTLRSLSSDWLANIVCIGTTAKDSVKSPAAEIEPRSQPQPQKRTLWVKPKLWEAASSTIWEGDPGHLRHFGLLVVVTSTSLRVYGARGVGAHPRNSLSLAGAILDIYSSLSEFISGELPTRGIDWLPGHPCKPKFLTVAVVLQCIIKFKGH